jgi:hypothetical protein
MAKVGFVSLGCSKNLVDTETMLARVAEAGYEITPEAEDADVVIINTCAFIQSAKEESIETIIDIGWLKEHHKLKGIVVCGCMAERYGEQIKDELPEVDCIVGLGSIDDIVEAVKKAEKGEKMYVHADKEQSTLGGDRVLTTGAMAYLKVAEGCDNRCTYCAIPLIRGKMRSRPMEDIVEEAKDLEKLGVKVAFFAQGENDSSLAYFKSTGVLGGGNRPIYAYSVAKEGKTLCDVYGRGNVFVGFSQKEIYTLLGTLRQKKRHSAVLALRADELAFVKNSDVSFAFDLIDYPSSKLQDAYFEDLEDDGSENSVRSAQLIKYEAGALLKRSSEESSAGPLCALLKLIKTSRSLKYRSALMLSYFVLAQIFRCVFVSLSVVSGLCSFSPFGVLAFGALFDVAAFCALSGISRTDLKGFRRAQAMFASPLKMLGNTSVTVAIFALIMWVFTFISSICGIEAPGAFSCIGLVISQITCFFIVLGEWDVKNVLRAVGVRGFILIFAPLLVCTVLSLIPRLGAILHLDGLFVYWIVSLILVLPVMLLVYFAYPRILVAIKNRKK